MVARGAREPGLAQIAGAQRGRVSRNQLIALGFTPRMIRTMRRDGRLLHLHRGVYAVGHLALIELGEETAALLACGPLAALGYWTAGWLWRMLPRQLGDIDVTIPAGTHAKSRTGIRVHRSRTLTPADIRNHQGLPVTSPARTLLDIAEAASPRQLEIALDEALATNILRLTQLNELLTRSEGRRGAPNLQALIAHRTTSTITHSKANERLLTMIRAAGLPQPETNLQIAGWQADFFWRTASFAIEVDSYQWHSSPFAFKRDRRKSAAFDDAGIHLTRITWEMMDHEPLAIIARLSKKITEGHATRKITEGSATEHAA